MPPGDGRNSPGHFGFLHLAGAFFPGHQFGEKISIIKDDTVGNEPGTFILDLLLQFGFDSQLSAICIRYRSFKAVILFSTIDYSLNPSLKNWRIDVIKKIDGLEDIINLAEGFFGFTLPGRRAQFSNYDALSC